jgi:hypothetical protein
MVLLHRYLRERPMSDLLERGVTKLAVSFELAVAANFMPNETVALGMLGLSGAIGQFGTLQTWFGLADRSDDQNRHGGHGAPVEIVRPPAPRPGPFIPRPEFL